MFNNCDELDYLDLPNYNTQNILDISPIFKKYNSSKCISKLNIMNTLNENDIFFEHRSLTTIPSIYNRNYLEKLLSRKDKEYFYHRVSENGKRREIYVEC